MPIVRINDNSIACDKGESLYTVLLRAGIQLNAPCGGYGTCGKCMVWIDGVDKVKACRYAIEKDITVSISTPQAAIAEKGLLRPVKVSRPQPSAAVDIGTTTVAAYLVSNGGIVDLESGVNAQKSYGDDVITRIKFTMDIPGGTAVLSDLITGQVGDMVARLCARNGLEVQSIAVVGNTTMLHLYAGVPPASIGVAPFAPVFTDLTLAGNAALLPSVAGYVGADAVAAILASGMHLSDKTCLLVDIGTNGEIALSSKDGIAVCAAAAGPAFEGAQISCGSGGVSGAINSVAIGETVTYTTIDNMPPVGICGSGVIDLVAGLLLSGRVDDTGYFADEIITVADGVTFTAQDVRQVQLAKAAIAAGIDTLLTETKTNIDDVDVCYLAGGFGTYMNPKSACDIGLLPKALLDKTVPIGNAAGMGCVLWQISDDCRAQTADIVKKAKYFELSDSLVFSEAFIERMRLG